MAKRNKYRKVSLKIHPISIVVAVLILAAVIVAICLAVPSYAESIANDYSTAATNNSVTQELALDGENRLKKLNMYQAVDAAKNNEVAVIYIGGTWSSTSVQWIGAIDGQFRKNFGTSDEPKILADYANNILYVEILSDEFEDIVDMFAENFGIKIKDADRYEPLVMSFANGKLVGNINSQHGTDYRAKAKNLFEKTLDLLV